MSAADIIAKMRETMKTTQTAQGVADLSLTINKDGLKTLEEFDAIYLGAVGFPSLVPDHISLWGLLLPIRKTFDLYVNLRPCRLLPGTRGPLRDEAR